MRLPPQAPFRHVLLVVDDRAGSITARLRSTALPAEVVTFPSAEAAACALMAGRRYSMLLTGRMDPDLAGAAARVATPLLTVSRAMVPEQLAAAVGKVAPVPLRRADWAPQLGPQTESHSPPGGRGPRGRLVAVCGPGGTGVSSVAAALTAAFGPTFLGGCPMRLLLADFALRADQAYLHGVDEPVTGLLDLVEACRYRSVCPADVLRHTVAMGSGRLLPGLRRPAHWTAVSPVVFDGMVLSLLGLFELVVADITGDFDGEEKTGSVDVEERNHMARACARGADVVVAVGGPGAHCGRRLTQVVDDLLDLGVDPARIQPVVNRLDRRPDHDGDAPRRRSPSHTAPEGHHRECPPLPPGHKRSHGNDDQALGRSGRRICGLPAPPVVLPSVAEIGEGPLPPEVIGPLVTAVAGLLNRAGAPDRRPALVRVTPGSLGCAAP